MRRAYTRTAAALIALALLVLPACRREERRVREVPPSAMPKVVVESDLQPGKSKPGVPTSTLYQQNAYAMSEGQRLFNWFNCVGCHGHGGGAIGPPLMDNKWIYGSDPANIFETIVEGRPNGMPAFRGKIPEYQVWQLVAYVRSMSGLAPKDAAPGRTDHMSVKEPESSTPTKPPKKTKTPG
jgi:cytochrome c oxidase cbb3-type subunit 3